MFYELLKEELMEEAQKIASETGEELEAVLHRLIKQAEEECPPW